MGLISYHGDENLKKLTIESPNHIFEPKFLEESLGIPGWICQIKDLFFCMFEKDENNIFEKRLLSSIPVGVNLDAVKWKFLSYILGECIAMLKNQTGNDNFIKERDDIIPFLEKTRRLYERMFVFECDDKELNDFSLISRTVDASLPRGLAREAYIQMYRDHAEKFIDLLKNEKSTLLFKFDSMKVKKKILPKEAANEYVPLIETNTPKRFKALKLFIKRIF